MFYNPAYDNKILEEAEDYTKAYLSKSNKMGEKRFTDLPHRFDVPELRLLEDRISKGFQGRAVLGIGIVKYLSILINSALVNT